MPGYAHGDHERDGRRATDRRGSCLVVRGRRSDRHRPQRELRPQIRGALLADIPTEGLGLFGDRGRVAEARLRGLAPGLPPKRRRLLSPGSQGGRRLPRPARDSRSRTPDDWYTGACRPARAGQQEDYARVGRAIAVRPQGLAQTTRLPLERRKRWQATVVVRGRR
jgi:hypothetical protein